MQKHFFHDLKHPVFQKDVRYGRCDTFLDEQGAIKSKK